MKKDLPKLGEVVSQTLHRFALVSKFSVKNTKRRDINLVFDLSISIYEHFIELSDESLIISPPYEK
jgi:hypothetical protein